MGVRTAVGSEARWALLLWITAGACSFDSAPIAVHGVRTQPPASGHPGTVQAGSPAAAGSGAIGGGAPPSNEPPPASGDPALDAAAPADAAPAPDAGQPPEPDAGATPTPDAGSQQPVPDAAPADTGAPPSGGLLFDPCSTDDDCSLGLVCYGSGLGYCAQPCAEDSECVDVGGVDFTCSSNDSACRVDCGEDGTDGICPNGMTCVEILSEARCLLSDDPGTDEPGLFMPCDLAKGDDDCPPGLVCYRAGDGPRSGPGSGPGYCTAECDGNERCEKLSSSSGVLGCSDGHCRLDCSDSDCPFGMMCERRLCVYRATAP